VTSVGGRQGGALLNALRAAGVSRWIGIPMGISSQKAPQQIEKNPPRIMLSTPWATFKAIAKKAKTQAQRLSPNSPPPTMFCKIAAIRPIAPCQAAWLPKPPRRSAPS